MSEDTYPLHNSFYLANFGMTKAEFDKKVAKEVKYEPSNVHTVGDQSITKEGE